MLDNVFPRHRIENNTVHRILILESQSISAPLCNDMTDESPLHPKHPRTKCPVRQNVRRTVLHCSIGRFVTPHDFCPITGRFVHLKIQLRTFCYDRFERQRDNSNLIHERKKQFFYVTILNKTYPMLPYLGYYLARLSLYKEINFSRHCPFAFCAKGLN